MCSYPHDVVLLIRCSIILMAAHLPFSPFCKMCMRMANGTNTCPNQALLVVVGASSCTLLSVVVDTQGSGSCSKPGQKQILYVQKQISANKMWAKFHKLTWYITEFIGSLRLIMNQISRKSKYILKISCFSNFLTHLTSF